MTDDAQVAAREAEKMLSADSWFSRVTVYDGAGTVTIRAVMRKDGEVVELTIGGSDLSASKIYEIACAKLFGGQK